MNVAGFLLSLLLAMPAYAQVRPELGGTGSLANTGTEDSMVVGDGTSFQETALMTCSAAQKLQYNVSTNTWTCPADDDVPESGDFGAAADLDSTGAVSIDSVALTTDTTGNYIKSIANGAGITGASTGEGVALTLSATLGTTIDAGEVTAGALDGNDMNAVLAGRSLTLSGTALNTDAELYTKVFAMSIEDPVAGDNALIQIVAPTALTITRVDCSTDVGTATIQFDERVLTTPNTAGTDVMTSTLVCDTNNQQTVAFTNSGIAASAILNLDVDAVATAPTVVRINVRYTVND